MAYLSLPGAWLLAAQINLIDEADIKPLLDELAPAIEAHHARALNPSHPHQRGTAQGPDVYMQAIEAANPFHKVSERGPHAGGGEGS
jgi:pyruvate/2-oxoacid:ferredoxin oxidoreductase alpha subunit